jgi:hypothetical protein
VDEQGALQLLQMLIGASQPGQSVGDQAVGGGDVLSALMSAWLVVNLPHRKLLYQAVISWELY